MYKKLLITGGSGFIGSSLIARKTLIYKGYCCKTIQERLS